MIVPATARYSAILAALDIENIPSVTLAPDDWVQLEDVDVDLDCDICGGAEPEPEDAVDPNLIGDFVAAIKAGDLATAQCLVGRVFATPGDIAEVNRAVFRCAA